nr:C-type lectin domain family 5 member A-like [Crassostrea gigas]
MYAMFFFFQKLTYKMNYLSGNGLPRLSKDLTSEFQLKPESTDRFVQVTRTSGRWRDLLDSNSDSNNTYIYKGSQSTELDGKQRNSSKTKLYAAILVVFTFLIVSCITVAVVSTMLYHEQNKRSDDGKNNRHLTRTTKSITTTTIDPTIHCKADSPDAQKCSEGWTLHGGSCYWLNTYLRSWDEAEETCRKKSATLVEVTTDIESRFLQEFARGLSIWVGANVFDSNININTCSRTTSIIQLTQATDSEKCVILAEFLGGNGRRYSIYTNRNCKDLLASVCEGIF